MLFAPTRVIVRSAKVNSARESVPVRTAVPSVTLSFNEAGRGAACETSSLTPRITCLTRPSSLPAPTNRHPALTDTRNTHPPPPTPQTTTQHTHHNPTTPTNHPP